MKTKSFVVKAGSYVKRRFIPRSSVVVSAETPEKALFQARNMSIRPRKVLHWDPAAAAHLVVYDAGIPVLAPSIPNLVKKQPKQQQNEGKTGSNEEQKHTKEASGKTQKSGKQTPEADQQ